MNIVEVVSEKYTFKNMIIVIEKIEFIEIFRHVNLCE